MWLNFLKKIRTILEKEVIECDFSIKNKKQTKDILSMKVIHSGTEEKQEKKCQTITFYKKDLELFWKLGPAIAPMFIQKNKLFILKKLFESHVQADENTKKEILNSIIKSTVSQHRAFYQDEGFNSCLYQIKEYKRISDQYYMVSKLENIEEVFQFCYQNGLRQISPKNEDDYTANDSVPCALVLRDLNPVLYEQIKEIKLEGTTIEDLIKKQKKPFNEKISHKLYSLFNTGEKAKNPGNFDVDAMLKLFHSEGIDGLKFILPYIAFYSAKLNQSTFFEWLIKNPDHPIYREIPARITAICLAWAVDNDSLAKLIFESNSESQKNQYFDRTFIVDMESNQHPHLLSYTLIEHNAPYHQQRAKLESFLKLIEKQTIPRIVIKEIYEKASFYHSIAWLDVLKERKLITTLPEWYDELPKRPFSFETLWNYQQTLHKKNERPKRNDMIVFSNSHPPIFGSINYINFIRSGLCDHCIEGKKVRELIDLMFLEMGDHEQATNYTLNLLRLFGANFINIEKYINKYVNPQSNQPVHDLCQFKLPQLGHDKYWDKSFWRNIALRLGPSGLKYIAFAVELEKHEPFRLYKKIYTSDSSNKLICDRLRDFACIVGYKRHGENKKFSHLCMLNGISIEGFEKGVSILASIDTNLYYKKNDLIPDITIKGDELIEADSAYVFRKMSIVELKSGLGLILGKIVNCCQHIDGEGSSCAIYGTLSNKSGFYLLEHQNRIIGQSWVWVDENSGTLCFDSWEASRQDAKQLLKPLLEKFSQKLFLIPGSTLQRVTLGRGGRTPRGCFPLAMEPAKLSKDFHGDMNDSSVQYIVATSEEKISSVTKDGFIRTAGVDTYVQKGKTVKTLALKKSLRNEFEKTHALTTALLRLNSLNPFLEEGCIDEKKRDHDGELFLTHEFLALLVYFKIIKHSSEKYDKTNIVVFKETSDCSGLINILMTLSLKEDGNNAKLLYISGEHSISIYLRNIKGKLNCFIIDSDPSDEDNIETACIIAMALPGTNIIFSTTPLQVDYFSCGIFAMKALMYFSKQGEKIFDYVNQPSLLIKQDTNIYALSSNIYALSSNKLPAPLWKLSQKSQPEGKMTEIQVSKRRELTLKAYHDAESATLFGRSYNLAAIRKKYRYIDQLEDALKKNFSENDLTFLSIRLNTTSSIPSPFEEIINEVSRSPGFKKMT
jgi:hypothetical protein